MTRYDTLLQNMTRTIFSLSILKMLSQATNNTVTQPCADWALGSGTCSLDWRILCTLWDWRMSIYIIYIFTYTFLCIYLIMKLYNYTCSYQYIYIYIWVCVCVCHQHSFIDILGIHICFLGITVRPSPPLCHHPCSHPSPNLQAPGGLETRNSTEKVPWETLFYRWSMDEMDDQDLPPLSGAATIRPCQQLLERKDLTRR